MYTYGELNDDINYLSRYTDSGCIGRSVLGNPIPFVHFGGYTGKQAVITGAIHARENVTARLVIRQAFSLLEERDRVCFDGGGIYFVPMVNPDGALLIERGADAFPERREFLIRANGGSEDFSLWKANINAVDLNTNFNAEWGTGKYNVRAPASENFIGEAPDSEPETACLERFTASVRPRLTLSYHALGREIYWFFHQKAGYERDKALAEFIEAQLGYKRVDGDCRSAGGYKDWCIKRLAIPAFTVEIVPDTYSHPLPDSALDGDFERNRTLPVKLLYKISGRGEDIKEAANAGRGAELNASDSRGQ